MQLANFLGLGAQQATGLTVRIGDETLVIDTPVDGETLKIDGVALNVTSSLPDGYAIDSTLSVAQIGALDGVSVRSNLDGTFTWLGSTAALSGVSSDQALPLDIKATIYRVDDSCVTRLENLNTRLAAANDVIFAGA